MESPFETRAALRLSGLAVVWVGLVAGGCGPGLSSEGGGSATETGGSPAGGGTSTRGATTLTTTAATSGPGCAPWSESCEARPCCNPEHACDPATQLCLAPGDTPGNVFLDGHWADGYIGVTFECDPFAQDCMVGEKCMPWANDGGPMWNATRCTPIDLNPVQVGDECVVEGSLSGLDNCALGLMCWDVDDRGVGVCEDMCVGSPGDPICDDPDDVCAQWNDGATVLCLLECDPLLEECVDGQACYPINDAFVCVPDTSGDSGVHGDACAFLNACDPGHICIGPSAHNKCAGAVGCCSTVCSVTDPNADANCAALDPGQSCESWFPEGWAPMGYSDVGVCAVPL